MIEDEYTNLDVSRQRKWALRKYRDGKCVICGRQADGSFSHCEIHRRRINRAQRERARKRYGRQRRNLNAESYEFGWPLGTKESMKRVRQTVRGKCGNCFAACVAAILELPLESMPNIYKSENGDHDRLWLDTWLDFLRPMGLSILCCKVPQHRTPSGYAIASMRQRDTDDTHAVVCFDGVQVHDPLDGVEDKPAEFIGVAEWYVFTVLDASNHNGVRGLNNDRHLLQLDDQDRHDNQVQ